MVAKQEIDDFINSVLKKHAGNKNGAFRETARRAIYFFNEKERLEKELNRMSDEISRYKTGSVNE